MRKHRQMISAVGLLTLGVTSLMVTRNDAHAAIQKTDDPAAVKATNMKLTRLLPDVIWLGDKFNYQPKAHLNGLSVYAQGASRGTRIVFAGQALGALYGGNVLSTLIPSTLVSKPGKYAVYLQNGAARSNTLYFIVHPRFSFVRLEPSVIKVGTTFNYQPKVHASVFFVFAQGAIPGTRLVFAGHALPTAPGSRALTAIIPTRLISKPGNYSVYLKVGGKTSNKLVFVVRQ